MSLAARGAAGGTSCLVVQDPITTKEGLIVHHVRVIGVDVGATLAFAGCCHRHKDLVAHGGGPGDSCHDDGDELDQQHRLEEVYLRSAGIMTCTTGHSDMGGKARHGCWLRTGARNTMRNPLPSPSSPALLPLPPPLLMSQLQAHLDQPLWPEELGNDTPRPFGLWVMRMDGDITGGGAGIGWEDQREEDMRGEREDHHDGECGGLGARPMPTPC